MTQYLTKENLELILNSQAFLLLSGFAINSLSSLFFASRLSKSSYVKRGIRLLHGLVNRIDPEGNEAQK